MGASVEKVSVAIGLEELEWARSRSERQGISLSAVLTEAARAAREREARQARQNASWEAFVAWASDGKGVSRKSLLAAEQELNGK